MSTTDAPQTSPATTPPSKRSSLLDKIVPTVIRERLNLHTGLERAVENSASPSVDESSLSQAHPHWLGDLFDKETLDKFFKKEHLGNYVQIRGTDKQEFESMPIYVRLGMHLVFYGKAEVRFLHAGRVRKLLKDQTLKQGKIYNSEDPKIVIPHIQSFIKTYSLDTSTLLNPDIKSYKTINEFFARRLKPSVRPIASPKDATIITSAADCRLTVWRDVATAQKFWVKGKGFSIAQLLGSPERAKAFGPSPSLAIFRLAPQDYHRFHTPVNGTLGELTSLPGEYYTVNPQAINESLDVLTANRRDVRLIAADLGGPAPVPVAFVAVGALLVASIGWAADTGAAVAKGDNIGWFQYGGSTCVVVFPTGAVTWDEDLIKTSETGTETLVKFGEHIGKATPAAPAAPAA